MTIGCDLAAAQGSVTWLVSSPDDGYPIDIATKGGPRGPTLCLIL